MLVLLLLVLLLLLHLHLVVLLSGPGLDLFILGRLSSSLGHLRLRLRLRIRSVEARLDKTFSLGDGDEWLQLGGGKSVNVPSFGGD